MPTLCFICGVLGHSDRYYSRLFDTLESEIVKSYGAGMRASFRRQTKLIGEKRLRREMDENSRNSNTDDGVRQNSSVTVKINQAEKSGPQNQEPNKFGGNSRAEIIQNQYTGALQGNPKIGDNIGLAAKIMPNKPGVTFVENKQ